MKNVSVSDTIETLTMTLQAGFIDTVEEIDAVSSIVSRLARHFLEECQETDTLPTEEVREVIGSTEQFLNVVVNSHNVDFIDEVESHGICLSIVALVGALGELKALVKSKW